MNTGLAANTSSLSHPESDLYESVVGKNDHYGGVATDERWTQEIKRLTYERDAVILTHNYQLSEVQDIAGYTGDSLGLSRIAAKADTDVIIFCGVHFVAETAKILSPEKTVPIPDGRAGCSLADSITADKPAEWKTGSPDTLVISYINTTADVRALTDICCTSSNAVDVVKSVPEGQEILFNPDQFFGAYIRHETGRGNIKVWAGECHAHANISGGELVHRAGENVDSQLFIHPECGCMNSAIYLIGKDTIEPERVQMLSAGEMLTKAQKLKGNKLSGKMFMATEVDILHQLCRAAPDVDFGPVNDRASCSYMKLITPAALPRCPVEGANEVDVEPNVIDRARTSIKCMIAIGNPGGGE